MSRAQARGADPRARCGSSGPRRRAPTPRDDRLPRLLLPLPRHAHRAPVLERSSSPPSTPRCCSAACSSASPTSTVQARRRRRSARWPTRSTAASTGGGPRPGRRPSSHGWDPERGFLQLRLAGYNEAMILYVLALGSPTHPVDAERLGGLDSRDYRWGDLPRARSTSASRRSSATSTRTSGSTSAGSGTRYMRAAGHRLLRELAARHARAARLRHREPERLGGLRRRHLGADRLRRAGATRRSRCGGRQRRFITYSARGASFTEIVDDGTIAPTAAGGSIAVRARDRDPRAGGDARALRRRRSSAATASSTRSTRRFTARRPVQHGRVVPGRGWFDTDYLGIDQGPILAMIENYRSGLVWRYMRRNPYIVRGLRRAGFTGGWLDQTPRRPDEAVPAGRVGGAAPCSRACSADAPPSSAGGDPALLGDGPRGRGGRASWCAASSARTPACASGAADPLDAPRTRSCSPRSSATRRPTSRSSATPGSRSSPRSSALEPLDRCVAASRTVRLGRLLRRASGAPTCIDGRALRHALVRRHAGALLPQGPPGAGRLRSACRTTGTAGVRAMRAVQAPDGPRPATRIFLPINEWAQPVILGLQAGSPLLRDDGRSARSPTRPSAGPSTSTSGSSATDLAPAGRQQRDRQPLPGVRARRLRDVHHRPVEPRRVPPPAPARAAGRAGPRRRCPGPTGIRPGVSLAGGSSLVLFRALAAQGGGVAADRVPVPARRSSSLLPAHRRPAGAASRPGRRLRPRRRAPTSAPSGRSSSASVPTPKVPEWEQIATMVCQDARAGGARRACRPESALARLDRDVNGILEKRRWLLARELTAAR